MKKNLKSIGSIVGTIFFAALMIYVFLIRPSIQEEAALKPLMFLLSSKFMECAYDDSKFESCFDSQASENFKVTLKFDQFNSLLKNVKKKLGPRLSAQLIDGKFNLTVSPGAGSKKRVNFAIQAAYENDLSVTETYQYSLDDATDTYKLDSVFFSSNKPIQ